VVTPYYDDGQIQIWLGDCLDVLPHLAPGCADLVLTDPPYNYRKDYGTHDDDMTRAVYAAWCRSWFDLVRIICPRTIVFPGHGNLPIWWDVRKPSAVGCWYKPGNGASSLIGFEEWEPWLYWTGNKGLLGGSSVVRSPVGKQTGVGGHPCPKPLDLFKRLLLKCKSEAVLDPFLGSGTTVVAAKHLGIRAIGIEIEERFCALAADRLRQGVLL
jgi:DNA modification methylase